MANLENLVEIETALREYLLEENYSGLTAQNGKMCAYFVLEFMRRVDSVLDRDAIFIKRITKIAHYIARSEGLGELLEKAYNFNLEGVQALKKNPPAETPTNIIILESHFLAHAGYMAETIFAKTQNLAWAKKWYDAVYSSAELARDVDPAHSAHAYAFAGNAAEAIFKITGDISWAKKGYDAYKLSATISKETDPNLLKFANIRVGNVAKIIFEKTGDLSWIEKAYDAYKLSAGLAFEHDPKFAIYSYYSAGEAAKAKCMNSPRNPRVRREWAGKAIACYRLCTETHNAVGGADTKNLAESAYREIKRLEKYS